MNKILSVFLFLLFTKIVCAETSLVWQFDRKISWEEDWIKEMLAGVNLKTIEDGKYQKFIDNSIIVISSNLNPEEHKAYFKKLYKMKYNFGIILLSDEIYSDPGDYYKYAKFVFRNYWHKKYLDQKNVFTFPLGYKTGFWKNFDKQKVINLPRNYVWSFAGQINGKPTREAMINQMKKVPNHFIHEIYAWAGANSLPVDAYRNLLLQSTFVPCPTGNWNLDSFRVYETLECGCIPIVEKQPLDYFGNYFGNHPFLVIDSWDQAPELINNLLSDPVRMEKKRQDCYTWWLNYKKALNKKLVKIVKSNLKN